MYREYAADEDNLARALKWSGGLATTGPDATCEVSEKPRNVLELVQNALGATHPIACPDCFSQAYPPSVCAPIALLKRFGLPPVVTADVARADDDGRGRLEKVMGGSPGCRTAVWGQTLGGGPGHEGAEFYRRRRVHTATFHSGVSWSVESIGPQINAPLSAPSTLTSR